MGKKVLCRYLILVCMCCMYNFTATAAEEGCRLQYRPSIETDHLRIQSMVKAADILFEVFKIKKDKLLLRRGSEGKKSHMEEEFEGKIQDLQRLLKYLRNLQIVRALDLIEELNLNRQRDRSNDVNQFGPVNPYPLTIQELEIIYNQYFAANGSEFDLASITRANSSQAMREWIKEDIRVRYVPIRIYLEAYSYLSRYMASNIKPLLGNMQAGNLKTIKRMIKLLIQTFETKEPISAEKWKIPTEYSRWSKSYYEKDIETTFLDGEAGPSEEGS